MTLLQRRAFHPWHDIPPGPTPPDVLTAVIEIPANERNKYELDKEIGLFRLDRVLHSAVHYPGDYGFIPQTYAEDDDPLDVICVMTEPVFPGVMIGHTGKIGWGLTVVGTDQSDIYMEEVNPANHKSWKPYWAPVCE